MKKILISLILLVSLGLVEAEESVEVQERDKKAILDISTKVMLASEKRDVATIMSFLDKSITIEIKIKGREPYSYDYERYKNYLTHAFSTLSSYSYEPKNETFRYENDKEIIFEFELVETYGWEGGTIKETHLQTWTVFKDKGKYRLTRVEVR